MSRVETLVFRPASLPPLSRLVLAAAVRVVTWENRQRTRKGLKRLDRHLLRDVGLDPITAEAEANRRFWEP
ncbi:MAG: DUF1127 domain-containing protein [Pseudotabrizicola sp.]|uniref:DUF1127 domain-containing protein n=1 Tax=Pseudotabrizicola sp. TaxID=2939647 RepID=UPI00271BB0FC|nr:DUF1127 domain-containing protein [Pseudotabrizicola sp.]MDO8881968.1 DUF1127 domain-containing protein [Pseudotabrizicola sp.]MDP2082705.1 DUF1127 domain-containing protein [Pseudotabrizicola sp.]MDZ7576322.1 DUF1127 domain-containing protein [Pseudotabrizicola sp.]